MSKDKTKTLLGVLQNYVPYYLAKYVEWYMTPSDKRCKWEELATCDLNFKSKEDGVMYKSQEFAENNWLPRADVQEAMQAYIKYFKRTDLTKLYQTMYDKAISGDVRAADWVVKFSESEFFNDAHDEINDFLTGVNIQGL